MKDVEERVLQMTFENDQFEKGVQTSINSLDKLNKSLDMTGASEGLTKVGQAANKINFGGLLDGLEQVKQKFSFIEVLGYNAFNRISNSILNAAGSFAKFISGVDGAREGLSKYGNIMTATNTLQIATGENLDKIKSTIEDLNWFSDETSYTLDQMIGTMSKFAASGVKLDDAANAVKGLSLWAAEAGQNAQTTNRVMYQLSQAYGRGYLMAQDWMSVETANMATQKIQNELIEEGGEKAKAAVKKYGGFRDSLRAQWLTTDVLNKVLAKYSEGVTEANFVNGELNDTVSEFSRNAFKAAQNARTFQDVINAVNDSISTGWYQTFEKIFGDKDQSAEFFTDMATDLQELADNFASARNSALDAWNAFGGRNQMITGLKGIYNGLNTSVVQIGKTIKNALFPKRTREEQLEYLKGLSDEGDELIDKIQSFDRERFRFQRGYSGYEEADEYLKGLYDQLDQLDDAAPMLKITKRFEAFGKTVTDVSDKLAKVKDAYNKVLDYRVQLENGATTPGKLEVAEESYDRIYKEATSGDNGTLVSMLLNLDQVIGGLAKSLKTALNFVHAFARAFSPWLAPISKVLQSFTRLIGAIAGVNIEFSDVTESSDSFYQIFKKISDTLLPTFEKVCDKAASALDWLAEKIQLVKDKIGNSKFLKDFNQYISDFKQSIKDSKVGQFFQTLKDGTEGNGGGIKQFFTNVGAGIKNFFDQTDEGTGKKKKSLFETIQEALSGVGGNISSENFIKDATKAGKALLGLFSILSGLKIVRNVGKILGNVSDLLSTLRDPLSLIQGGIGGKNNEAGPLDKFADYIKRIAAPILMIAASIGILAKSVVDIGNMDIDGLLKGFAGLAVICGAVIALVHFLSGEGKSTFKAKYMELPDGTFRKGVKSTSWPNQIIKGVSGLLIVAFAIRNLSRTVKSLGDMSWGDMIQGLIGMASCAAVILAVSEMLGNNSAKGKFKNLQVSGRRLLASAAGFAIIADSLLAVAASVRIIGTMDIPTMWSSLGVMVGAVAAIAAAIDILGNQKGLGASHKLKTNAGKMLAAGGAFIMIANAMLPIAASLRIVGTMDIPTMWNAMASLGIFAGGMLLILDAIAQQGGKKADVTSHNGYAQRIIAAGFAFGEIAAAVLPISAALRIVGTMDIATMWNSMASLASFSVIVLGMMDYMAQQGGTEADVTSHSSYAGRVIAAGFAFAEIATALLPIAASLRIVGTMDIATMWNSLAVLGSLSVAILLLLDNIAQQGSSKGSVTSHQGAAKRMMAAGFAFDEIATGLVLVATSIRIIGTMKPAEMWSGLASLAIMTLLVLFTLDTLAQQGGKKADVTSHNGYSKRIMAAAGAFATIAGSLTGVAYAIKVVGSINSDNLIASMISLVGMLAAISAVLMFLGNDKTMKIFGNKFNFNPNGIGKAALAFFGISTSLLLVATSLKLISGINPDALGQSVLVLVGSLAAITTALIAINKFGGATGGGKAILAGAGSILIVAGAIAILTPALMEFSKLDGTQIGSIAATLASSLGIISGVIIGLSFLKGPILAVGGALALFGAGIALMGVGVEKGANGIANLAESSDTLVESVSKLAALNDQTDNVDDAFTQLSDAYKNFGTAIGNTGFWAEGRSSGIVNLVNSTGTLVDTVERLIGIDKDKAADVLTGLGDAYSSFGEAIKNTGLIGAEGKADALSSLAAGSDQMSTAIERLGKLKPAEAAQGIYAIKDAFVQLGAALKEISSGDDGLKWYESYSSKSMAITEMADSANTLSLAIYRLSEADDASGAVDNLSRALTDISTIDLSGSGTSITEVANAVDTLVTSLTTNDASGLMNSFRDSLVNLNNASYQITSGVVPSIDQTSTATDDLTASAEDLKSIDITSIGTDYQNTLDQIQAAMDNVDSTNAVDMINSLQSAIGTSDLSKWTGGIAGATTDATAGTTQSVATTSNALGSYLTQLGTDITTFATTVQDSGATTVASDLTDALTNLNTVPSGVDWSGFFDAGKNIIDKLIDGFNNNSDGLVNAVKQLMDTLVTTISGKETDLKTAFGTVVRNSAASLQTETYFGMFQTVGDYFDQGIAAGISSGTHWITDAATAAASAAKQAAMDALGEKSPSKVGRQIGGYFSIGIAQGIIRMAKAVDEAGRDVADTAVHGVQVPSVNYKGPGFGTAINFSRMSGAGYTRSSSVTNNNQQSKTITLAPVVNINGNYTAADGARIARDLDRQLGKIL